MLLGLRSAAKTKFAGIIIGALILAFALWGVSDIFRGTVSDTVAQVGDTEISAVELTRQLRERMLIMGQQTGTAFTLEDARQFGMDDIVLNEIISRAAIDEIADGLGLTASFEAVRDAIQSQAGFQGPNGEFNALQFQRALANAGYTEQGYVEVMRDDIARSQLLLSVGSGVVPPEGLANLMHDFYNETRVANYIVLTPDDAGEIPPPTESDISAFHAAHPELFNAPEYRSIDYVVIGPEQVADEIEISEEELRAEYENPLVPFNTPERREIQQIVFDDQAAAQAAKMRIDEGTDFLTIAQERGLNEDDITRGNVTAAELGGAAAEAAFAVEEGGVTEPVQGQFGWLLLRAVSVTPGTELSFEEAREQIRRNLVANRAANLVADVANAFEDARAGGATLAEAAMSVGIEHRTIEAVDRQGLLPDGTMAPIPDDPAFIEQVFATEAGEESFLFPAMEENIEYAVRVNGITPASLRPLDEVRAEVEAAWMAEARANALMEMASGISEQAQSGSLEAAADDLGREVMTSMPLERSSYGEVFGPQLMQQLFSVPQSSMIYGLAANGQDYVVARVEEVSHPVPDPASAEYQQLLENIGAQLGNDLIEAFADAARDEVGVTTYPATIETALGQGVYY